MSFVRKATDYSQQNLVISQEGGSLYFTTTRNVLPKEELKVGYSLAYANCHKLQVLKPDSDTMSWPCFECSEAFSSSADLQKHLNVHDDDDESLKAKKKSCKKIVQPHNEAFKCNNCHEVFVQPGKLALRQHLIEKHLGSRLDLVDDYFSTVG